MDPDLSRLQIYQNKLPCLKIDLILWNGPFGLRVTNERSRPVTIVICPYSDREDMPRRFMGNEPLVREK
jgi:hypothetical protein